MEYAETSGALLKYLALSKNIQNFHWKFNTKNMTLFFHLLKLTI